MHKSKLGGFTVVELLVVISLIAILIGILLPSLSLVRARARLVECSSNQRSIVQAALQHAATHHGYLPLAGELVVDPESSKRGKLPAALNDSARTRYDYLASNSNPSFDEVVPFAASVTGDFTASSASTQSLSEWFTKEGTTHKMFRCPSVSAESSYNLISNRLNFGGSDSAAYGTLYNYRCDFAVNANILNFDYRDRSRLAGRLTGMRDSSKLALITDADSTAGWRVWQADESSILTLTNSLPGSVPKLGIATVSLQRHRGKINVGFVDGHCQTLNMTRDDLSSVNIR